LSHDVGTRQEHRSNDSDNHCCDFHLCAPLDPAM
jgi:hypothetical protein